MIDCTSLAASATLGSAARDGAEAATSTKPSSRAMFCSSLSPSRRVPAAVQDTSGTQEILSFCYLAKQRGRGIRLSQREGRRGDITGHQGAEEQLVALPA